MKKFLFAAAFTAFLFLPSPLVFAATRESEGYVKKAELTIGNLTLRSYSDAWNAHGLEKLYEELLKNFHSDELSCLAEINLYPDAPGGGSGAYFEDSVVYGGNFYFGKNAYIELYNADLRTTPETMAFALAHEYGHHYTIYNISMYEKKYYTGWKNIEYSALRLFGCKDAAFDPADTGCSYEWDITEIAANDYVQLLSSPNARRSVCYRDSLEVVTDGLRTTQLRSFNRNPQENTLLPLAADCTGLYEYLLRVGGYTGEAPDMKMRPRITSITAKDEFINKSYTVQWLPGSGSGVEYTVVMFPVYSPRLVTAIKTVSGASALKAVFGTVANKNIDGTVTVTLDSYYGLYGFRVYAKDKNGYMFSSEIFYYNFGSESLDSEALLADYRSHKTIRGGLTL